MATSVIVDPCVGYSLGAPERRRFRSRVSRMARAGALRDDDVIEYELVVRLTSDDEIQILNQQYRGKDRPTDVLSFSQREGDEHGLHPELLGDVIISVDTAIRQAKHGLFEELMFLVAHGFCHLLGYDHQTDEEEREMNQRCRELLSEAARTGRTRAA